MSGPDRKEVIRRDCKACRGKGYIERNGEQLSCQACGGSGTEEKEVDYDFRRDHVRSEEEIDELFDSN